MEKYFLRNTHTILIKNCSVKFDHFDHSLCIRNQKRKKLIPNFPYKQQPINLSCNLTCDVHGPDADVLKKG